MASAVTKSALVDAARRAVDAAQERPADALQSALAVLADAAGDHEVEAMANWAAGLAQRELNRLPESDELLVRAITQAVEVGRTDIAGGARTSRALVLTYLGRSDEGLSELDIAEGEATGTDLARVHMQRALILQRQGHVSAAIDALTAALPALVAGGDRLAATRLRINRGIALAYRDEFAAADDDLQQARATALELGQTTLAVMCAHNLGFVSGRQGDVPRALAWFDQAATEYEELSVEAGLAAVLLVDRAHVLLDAGLTTEAVEATTRAVALLEPTGNSTELAEAELLAARAALAANARAAATRAAARAAEAFSAQGRAGWAVLADYVHLLASDADAERAATLADRLDDAGWSVEAATAHGLAGRLAAEAGDATLAGAQLAIAARSRTSGPVAARVAGWHAEALLRKIGGDRTASRQAVSAGLEELERHRATLGATDLRAYAARYGARLADLAVADALDVGGAADLLGAAESWRAGSLALPARPPADPELADLLSRLRVLTARRREDPSDEADRELRDVEDSVRDLVRARPGAGGVRTVSAFDLDALTDALGARALVEWIVHRGRLHAVTVVDGRVQHTELGQLEEAADAIASMRMCLHRLAVGAGSARSLDAARATLDVAATETTRLLFGPLAGDPAGRDLVLVPTGVLHATPWLALGPVRAVATTMAPSARTWLAATGRERRAGVLLAAGPGLPGAAAEIGALADAIPGAVVLAPDDASVDAVLTRLGTVGVAHLAAHGRFRSDNPQFSALQFRDGDLTVYDLETLPQVPDVLVLSACDAAATGVRAGDELLGLSAALLAMGAGSLVAPSVPVPDDVTAPLMVALQRALATGGSTAEALRDAVGDAPDSDHASFAAVRSFVAMGA